MHGAGMLLWLRVACLDVRTMVKFEDTITSRSKAMSVTKGNT